MEYIYAAMILHSAEKDINEENVKSIIEAAGIEADDARIKALIAALEDVDIDEAMECTAMAAAPAAAPAAAAPAEEEAVEEDEKLQAKVDELIQKYAEGSDDELNAIFEQVVSTCISGMKESLQRMNIIHDDFVW